MRGRFDPVRLIARVAALLLSLSTSVLAVVGPQPVTLHPIALEGSPIPANPGLVFGNMTPNLGIAPDGSIAFYGSVVTTGNPMGVFGYDPVRGVRMVALDNTLAPVNDPFLGNTSYNGMYSVPTAASGGRVVFPAAVNPTYPNNVYYFYATPQTGTTLAGPAYSSNMFVAPDGNLAYVRGQTSSYTQTSLVSGPPGAQIIVAGVNDAAAGVPGSTYGNFSTAAAVNGGGIVFFSQLQGSGIHAVFRADVPGGVPVVQLMGRDGMPAAGVPGTPPLNNLWMVSASRSGHALISGVISGAPTGTDVGMWSIGPDNTMRLIAREGDPLPGTAGFSVTTFTGNVNDADIGDGGHVAFKQNIGGTDGLWRFSFGQNTLEMLDVPGRQIPGLPPGWRFGGTLGRPQLDVAGNAIFYDAVRAPDNTVASALVWAGIDGQFEVIIRDGDIVSVNGNNKQVSFIGHTLTSYGNYWLSPRTLNDVHQMAISLDFTDGSSGVFLARIPEPSGCMCVALSLYALSRRSWRSGKRKASSAQPVQSRRHRRSPAA